MTTRSHARQLAMDVTPRVAAGTPVTTPLSARHAGTGLHRAGVLSRATKRGMDIVLGTLLVAILLPLIAALVLAIRIDSRGPALFSQTRVGRGGRTFRLYKFRSMHHDAEAHRADLEVLNECEGPVFKIRHDPRVTRIGRILRRMSLDELPQLANVVMGQMSLVGPRPPLPAEVALYSDHHRRRLLVKPGLTCIWQTSGRSELGFEEWVDLDIEYIEHWSLWLDLKLLVLTVPAVLTGRGAY